MKFYTLSTFLIILSNILISSISLAIEINTSDRIDFLDFEDFQYKITSVDFQNAFNRIVHPSLKYEKNLNFLRNDNGIYAIEFLRNPDEPILNEQYPDILYTLHFGDQTDLKSTQNKCFSSSDDLSDLNIILDPGHMDEEYADLDDRRVTMIETGYTFTEARLNLFTAYALRDLLEARGAKVLLTRTLEKKSTLGISFKEWSSNIENIVKAYRSNVIFKQGRLPTDIEQTEAIKWFLEPGSIMSLFRLYSRDERLARQDFVNQQHPEFSYSKADLFLSIHYNGMHIKHDINGQSTFDPKNEKGLNIGHSYNFNMGFVPGSFMSNSAGVSELEENSSKYHFLRQILDKNLIDESIKFCKAIVDELSNSTGIRQATQDDAYYLVDYSTQAHDKSGEIVHGIFHRNLDMTRMASVPLCAAEALVQDNFDEAARLSRYEENQIDGLNGPDRALQVAQGFYKGILKYINQKKCNAEDL
ncbi:MAG: N-acetylmuramoyl-L-alanine amidase [Halobacteriovoraceae bacterium]|nr:N-acetylmuramoyl-L-alanine amidase [Halobacteriovoraceae bacterium]